MLPDGVDPLALVRRYEPVLRYTAGELFLPMSVDAYVGQAALWSVDPATGAKAALVVDHGELDLDRLCARARDLPDARLELRFVAGALGRRDLRRWRRDPERPRLRATSRFAAVGLFGRIVDSFFRLSLVLRGRVPGGLTAAAHQTYRRVAAGTPISYYAHVTADGGYVALQYWFFYAMNDWRSSFAGVNDHEADWEQVTVYLADTGDGVLAPAWVAFSSHDKVGPDLRRRVDDPDLSWVDGTHPVVYVGAGSHSGAYLAGDYLVRVEPPALARTFAAGARVRSLLFPWTKGRPRTGLGIPYVDYKRGEGARVGPGTGRPWTAVVIDDRTPWVRDFRGLWGLDTADPFGGERAPAGPRYHRDGTVRESWADPVAWAGLDAVAPDPKTRDDLRRRRLDALSLRHAELDAEIAARQEEVRLLAAGGAAAHPARDEEARRLGGLRAQRRAVVAESEAIRRLQDDERPVPPHAHLRRREVPDPRLHAPPGLLLRFWTEASLSVLLGLLGVALLLNLASAPEVVVTTIFVVMFVEALLRRRMLLFLLGATVLALLAVGIWLAATNWRAGLGGLALLAAITLAVANIRALLARR